MMGKLYQKLREDVRFTHGLHACIHCGTCTAICPAASFYEYDPREITDALQVEDEKVLEDLLSGDTIWYCGQCMSCKTRCPRGNTPGLLIQALRNLSIDSGLYMNSMRGRQMYALKKTIGESILNTGYCVHADNVDPEMHPEQGPIWSWIMRYRPEVYNRFGNSYNAEGNGALRKIPDHVLEEIHRIFDVTGSTERFRQLEDDAARYAKEHGIDYDSQMWNDYFFEQYEGKKKDHES
jgi:heterodisulfide reductase subunit C